MPTRTTSPTPTQTGRAGRPAPISTVTPPEHRRADDPDADGPDADGPDADGPDADDPDADGPDADT